MADKACKEDNLAALKKGQKTFKDPIFHFFRKAERTRASVDDIFLVFFLSVPGGGRGGTKLVISAQD